MTIIGSRKSWKLNTQESRMKKGPLIRVKHPDGHYTKMYEADAVEQGLIPGKKALPPAPNKMLVPEANKGAANKAVEPDDFTSIEGIGPAAARSIVAQGITTFAQLRAAKNLSLGKKALAAIEAWKND